MTIRVSPGTTARRTGSIVLMALGGAAALGCGVSMPVALQADTPVPGLAVACLLGGVAALGAGIGLLVTNKTTYALALSHEAGVIRF